MIILGIDPGLATVGISLLRVLPNKKYDIIDCCTIETSAVLSMPERLQEIADDLRSIISDYHPDLAVIEKLFFQTNRKTAIDVAEARGVALLCAAEVGITIIEPTPLELKSCVTGDGHADKQQMRDMLQRTFDIDLSAQRDDAVDALGLALYGALVPQFVGV